MPWYNLDNFKNKICRYLLQRYLGRFLEEKLRLDQLTVDLIRGTGTVTDVFLDVEALNLLGKQQNLPIEFVEGYISQVSISIPWGSLFSEGCFVEVKGLTLSVQPRKRDNDGASMFESMWSSMTTSMQLAEECFKQGGTEDEKEAEKSQPFEGLEKFALAIDSVLSMVKVQFLDTVVQIEHCPRNSSTGVALEIRIKKIQYSDEAGLLSPGAGDKEQKVYEPAAFSTKKFYFEGTSLYSDEFPAKARYAAKSTVSTSSSSPEPKVYGETTYVPASPSAPGGLLCDVGHHSVASDKATATTPEPILMVKLAGRQEVRIRLKQNEAISGPKVALECNFGSFISYMSPRQVHTLLELAKGLAFPDTHNPSEGNHAQRTEKPMEASDFRRVEEELLQQMKPSLSNLSQGLQPQQGWSSASLEDSDDEFLPMSGRGAGASSSVMSDVTDMDASFSSTASSGTVRSDFSKGNYFGGRRYSGGGRSSGRERMPRYGFEDMSSEVTHFCVRVSSFALVILHDDILTTSVGNDGRLAASSINQMRSSAEDFFRVLGLFAISGYGNKDFEAARDKISDACKLSHLRVLCAPVIFEGNEKHSSSCNMISGTLKAGSMEVLECIVDKKPTSNRITMEYVELLKFHRGVDQEATSGFSDPCFKMDIRYSEKVCGQGTSRRVGQPTSVVRITLQPCESEVDLSIVDRITNLLNPQPLAATEKRNMPFGVPPQACFSEAVEASQGDHKLDLSLFTPHITLNFRFPVPDLRPIHDMDRPPWWKRSVRSDILILKLSDATLETCFDSRELSHQYEVRCREVQGYFTEGGEQMVSFLHSAVDEKEVGLELPNSEGFGWPRFVLQIHPEIVPGHLEDSEPEPEESMAPSFDTFMSTIQVEPSPFSSKRVIHESCASHESSKGNGMAQEMLIPGDKQEMSEFMEQACRRCRYRVELSLPTAHIVLPSKHFYEVLYNRINTDFFLWEPAAPKPMGFHCGGGGVMGGGDLYHASLQPDLTAGFLQESLYPSSFSMCKSGIQGVDTDSDSDEEGGMYYSVYEHKQRQRKKQQQGEIRRSGSNQSKVAATVTISKGTITLHSPARDTTGNVIPGHHGECMLQVEDGSLFSVSSYRGDQDLGYICIQVNKAAFYHNGLISDPTVLPSVSVDSRCPSHLFPTIVKSGRGVVGAMADEIGAGGDSLDMLSVAIRVQCDDAAHMKTFRVAATVRGATLHHRVSQSGQSWFSHLVDFIDVLDYPVEGYSPLTTMLELHLNWWKCAVDYRPLHLPLRSLIAFENLAISSNIAAQSSTSVLRFIVEDSALYLSDKLTAPQVDLDRNYVCVLSLGLFELSLRLSEAASSRAPKVDLMASNNIVHIWTCADSCKALAELLIYFASDGDLVEPVEEDFSDGGSQGMPPLQSLDGVLNHSEEEEGGMSALSKSQVDRVHTLMAEAMRDVNGGGELVSEAEMLERISKKKKGVEVFFFPDENQKVGEAAAASKREGAAAEGSGGTVDLSQALEDAAMEMEIEDDSGDDEFCLLEEDPGIGFRPRSGEPEVRVLTSEPIQVLENHFTVPLAKTDILKAPKHFPSAVFRYVISEVSVKWHMYGGHDFQSTAAASSSAGGDKKNAKIDDSSYRAGSAPPTLGMGSPASPTSCNSFPPSSLEVGFSKLRPNQVHFGSPCSSPPHSSRGTSSLGSGGGGGGTCMARHMQGGPGRHHSILMELHLNKVRFQYEVYPEECQQASRQVLVIKDVEMRDRLATSQMNKFLYQYTSQSRPKQRHANMVVIKALHIRPDPKLKEQECCLKVSVLPVRLNIDQDALMFLYNFFSQLTSGKEEPELSPVAGSGGDSGAAAAGGGGVGSSSGTGTGGTTPPLYHHTPTHQSRQVPVMSVTSFHKESSLVEHDCPRDSQQLLILLEETADKAQDLIISSPSGREGVNKGGGNSGSVAGSSGDSSPVYFRSFVFASDVPIRIDYHGKRVDMSHGPLAGLLMGLGQLNCLELNLKRLNYRHGLLGFNKLVAYMLTEWLQDIKKNQLPSVLGGVGPMHSFVQLFQGIRDLFWLPIEQYQRDGRIVRGIQRGASSFSTSTAMAALELTNRLVQLMQGAAELAYDVMSPGPSLRQRRIMLMQQQRRHMAGTNNPNSVEEDEGEEGDDRKRRDRYQHHHPQHLVLSHPSSHLRHRRYNQPSDIREGMSNAYQLVKEGLGETAQLIVQVASEEHEQKGVSGAVGGVLRQIPPSIVKPIILATEATSNVLGGMCNQLQPDVRKEAVEKWRRHDQP